MFCVLSFLLTHKVIANMAEKTKRPKKLPTPARAAAMKAVEIATKANDAAKSPQEKKVAGEALKVARDALKALKFLEIGAPRIKRAINVMRQLENVANPNAYAWTPEHAEKAIKALTEALDSVKAKLLKSKTAKTEFTF
jgi:hypothetical protein